MIHQFNFHNTLGRLIAPEVGAKGPYGSSVILLEKLTIELVGEERFPPEGYFDGDGCFVYVFHRPEAYIPGSHIGFHQIKDPREGDSSPPSPDREPCHTCQAGIGNIL